jgi:hypothetical protein
MESSLNDIVKTSQIKTQNFWQLIMVLVHVTEGTPDVFISLDPYVYYTGSY